MTQVLVERLAVIGCGLMGGSFALGLRQRGLVGHVRGYSSRDSTRQKAVALGVIDEACESVAQTVTGADLVLLAVPVQATELTLSALAPHLGTHTLLMDVGSTKCDVIEAARHTLGLALPRFVPAHPIAGKEVAGVEHADAQLYQRRQVYLTPMAETDPSLTARAQVLWQSLGSKVNLLGAEFHDQAFAAVSHLPHLLAFGFMNGLSAQEGGAELVAMGGPGFRDFSRIAASDPTVWRDILLANRLQVLAQLQHTQTALAELEQTMRDGNGLRLHELIEASRLARSGWRLLGDTE
ncbi:MAG: prephenate dehydrogenase/arogenate dehydrogenase family protein [Alphaproteobacteria bacterium]|nr:prephenate dehydrogenase/arogenate dehydrogenase family protein [Alphaproteobacteria bacterium]